MERMRIFSHESRGSRRVLGPSCLFLFLIEKGNKEYIIEGLAAALYRPPPRNACVLESQIKSDRQFIKMALRDIPPVATFSLEGMKQGMKKSLSLETTFDRLDNQGDKEGMWNLITHASENINEWTDGVDGWIPAPYAIPLAQHVKVMPSGWFNVIEEIDSSFARLVDLIGYDKVKITGLKNKTEYNGLTGKRGIVYVKQGQLGVSVQLESGQTIMVKPAYLRPFSSDQ